MVESCVDPAISATDNTIISMAGSASDAIITSRDEPMPPKLVPMSIAASACTNRALPSSAVIAIRSPDQLNSRPVANVGTKAAATQVTAKITYGAARNSQEAFSESTTSLPSNRFRSRYGWISDGPRRRCSLAFTLRTKPSEQGCQQEHQSHLCALYEQVLDHCHSASTSRRMTSAANTKPR